jgi:membrane protein
VIDPLKTLEQWLFAPPPGALGRIGSLLQRVLRYVYAIIRDLLVGDVNLRAMSLVYTSILSTVPLCAVTVLVLKGFGFHHVLAPMLGEFFHPLGDSGTELTRRVLGFVDHARSGVVGSVGLILLLWTAISLVQKVEDACNHIWHVGRARSLGRRIGDYLGILVLGPLVVATTLGLTASLGTTRLGLGLRSYAPLATLGGLLGQHAPIIVATIGFTLLYAYIPNTRVRPGPALGGGLAAAIVWVAASSLFTWLVSFSTQMVAVYASFAIVLFALMWLWINWIILLLGAVLAFYLQHPAYLRTGQREVIPTARLREELAVSVMALLSGESPDTRWDLETLATRLAVPGAALVAILEALEWAGLLEQRSHGALVARRSPADVSVALIYAALRDAPAHATGRTVSLENARTLAGACSVSSRVDAAVNQALDEVRLTDVIERDRPPRA